MVAFLVCLCVPVMDMRPVHGMPQPLHNDCWMWAPATPVTMEVGKKIRDGWVDMLNLKFCILNVFLNSTFSAMNHF